MLTVPASAYQAYLQANVLTLALMLVVQPLAAAMVLGVVLADKKRRTFVAQHFPEACDFSHKYDSRSHLHRVMMQRWLYEPEPNDFADAEREVAVTSALGMRKTVVEFLDFGAQASLCLLCS